jgi:hypothetical protein
MQLYFMTQLIALFLTTWTSKIANLFKIAIDYFKKIIGNCRRSVGRHFNINIVTNFIHHKVNIVFSEMSDSAVRR